MDMQERSQSCDPDPVGCAPVLPLALEGELPAPARVLPPVDVTEGPLNAMWSGDGHLQWWRRIDSTFLAQVEDLRSLHFILEFPCKR